MLQLCGCYLSQGGSEQIGVNGTAGVCLMSQHAAQAWDPQRRLSPHRTKLCVLERARQREHAWLFKLNSTRFHTYKEPRACCRLYSTSAVVPVKYLHQSTGPSPKRMVDAAAPCLTKLPLIHIVASFYFFRTTSFLINSCIQGALFYHACCMRSSIFNTSGCLHKSTQSM